MAYRDKETLLWEILQQRFKCEPDARNKALEQARRASQNDETYLALKESHERMTAELYRVRTQMDRIADGYTTAVRNTFAAREAAMRKFWRDQNIDILLTFGPNRRTLEQVMAILNAIPPQE